jgi:hypothetical protein
VPFVEVLHQKETKKSDTGLSYQDAKTLVKNNYDDGRGCGGSPIDDQRYIFNTNKEDHKKSTKKKKKKSRKEEKNTEKEVCEPVYVRSVTPLRKGTDETRGSANIPCQQNSIGEESGNDAYTLSKCPNHGRICMLQSSLGKLFRIGALDGSLWTDKLPEMPCYFVFPNDTTKEKCDSSSMCQMSVGASLNKTPRNNSLVLVEEISKSDCFRVATSLNLKLHDEYSQKDSMKELICNVQEVVRFGFTHIIFIGRRYCGMIFIDCYGRVFDWDSMNYILWFLGDYFEIISKGFETSRIAWYVLGDRTVCELDICKYCILYFAYILP